LKEKQLHQQAIRNSEEKMAPPLFAETGYSSW